MPNKHAGFIRTTIFIMRLHKRHNQMKTYIALFRAINIGGKNILTMKALIAILENLGALKVKTYIQSGNALFQTSERNLSEFKSKLISHIKLQHGFEPQIMMVARETIEKVILESPYPEAETDPSSLHLGFLATPPSHPQLAELNALKKESERFHLSPSVFYLHTPEGIGRSKLAAKAEKLLGVAMTYRNWKTVCKIREMADEG
ncbi:DUF1697 domain-containing protein [Iodobacter fluviatilis]|nr:DUF1697 domain-containing protein [Iodobacter fluviatilis]